MEYCIKASEIFIEDEILKDGYILIKDDFIKGIYKEDKNKEPNTLDLSNYKIIPGLIDLHIHGANGFDTMDSNYNALNEISKYLAKNGVTAFLPTTVTADWESIKNAVVNIENSKSKGVDGAIIIGAYIEGPFITEKNKGAHPENFIKKLNNKDVNELIELSNGNIKIMTIAPEKEGSLDIIKKVTLNGVKVSIGHTNATFNETKDAIENGANIAVHTFNGMRGLHHREPGVVGAVLSIDEIFAELIADNIHVHPEVIKILVKCKGTDKICLISDCMRAGGLVDGEYTLGELEVIVKDSIPRVKSGSLAGSTLKLIDGIKNIIQYVGVNPLEAVHMASLVPAKILGIDNKFGSIKENKKANLTIIDDDYNIIMTIVNGKIVYKNKDII